MKTEDIIIIGAIAAGAYFLIRSRTAAAQTAQGRPTATGAKATPSAATLSAWIAAGMTAMKNAGLLAMGSGGTDATPAEYGPYVTQYDGVTVGNSWQDIATFTLAPDASSGASMSVPLSTYQLPL